MYLCLYASCRPCRPSHLRLCLNSAARRPDPISAPDLLNSTEVRIWRRTSGSARLRRRYLESVLMAAEILTTDVLNLSHGGARLEPMLICPDPLDCLRARMSSWPAISALGSLDHLDSQNPGKRQLPEPLCESKPINSNPHNPFPSTPAIRFDQHYTRR